MYCCSVVLVMMPDGSESSELFTVNSQAEGLTEEYGSTPAYGGRELYYGTAICSPPAGSLLRHSYNSSLLHSSYTYRILVLQHPYKRKRIYYLTATVAHCITPTVRT